MFINTNKLTVSFLSKVLLMFKCFKWRLDVQENLRYKALVAGTPSSLTLKDIWLMSSTWGQQRHFHKSFYGSHHLGRTWAKAVFSFQSPQAHGPPPPCHWDHWGCSQARTGLHGVLQSLLAQTRQGSHHNHFLPSLTWNLKAKILMKI